MKYIIDTDILIYFLKGNKSVVTCFLQTPLNEIATTIINYTELLFGAYHSHHKKQNLAKIESFLEKMPVVSFCKESSHIFAEHKADLKKKGNIIADLDLMIASIAIKSKSTLITNNVKHFSRIKALKIENWYKPE